MSIVLIFDEFEYLPLLNSRGDPEPEKNSTSAPPRNWHVARMQTSYGF